MRVPVAIVSLLAIASAVDGRTAELNGYALLTTDYVRRGVTQSGGDAAFQLGLEFTSNNGWYLGAWGSTIDIYNGPLQRRELETNYYFGFAHDVGRRWTLGGNVVMYKYPGADTFFDYDYLEYSVSANFDDRLWLEYAYSPDLYDSGEVTHNFEVYGEWPLANAWSLGAGLGRYDTSGLTGDIYSYWQAGITRHFKRLDVDLRYHDSSRWVRIISTPDTADARLSLSVQLPF